MENPSSNLAFTRVLLASGWPVQMKGGQYWELLLKHTQTQKKQLQSLSHLLQAGKLLYYSGAPWCPTADQCLKTLLELFSAIPQTAESVNEDINWLIRALEEKSLVSLQQLCIWRVRAALGMDFLHKVYRLVGMLPHKILVQITMRDLIGDLFEQFLERELRGKQPISLSNEQIFAILIYLLDLPARVFSRAKLVGGRYFSMFHVLELPIPSESLEVFQSIMDLCIAEQIESNPEPTVEILRARLNWAIQKNSERLVQYLLDKVSKVDMQFLRAGRSPFTAGILRQGDSRGVYEFQQALRRSLAQKTDGATKCSPLVVACLADSTDTLELLRGHHVTFDFSHVSFLSTPFFTPFVLNRT